MHAHEIFVRKIERYSLLVLGGLTILSFPVVSREVSLGLLLGGLLSLFNFHMMSVSVAGIISSGRKKKFSYVTGFGCVFRYFLIAAALYIFFKSRLVDPLSLVVGLSVFVVTLIAGGILQSHKE